MAERGRGRGLARQAAQCQADFGRFLSSQDDRRLRDATTALYQADSRVRANPKDAAQYDDAEQHLAAVRDDLLARYPRYRSLQGQQPPTPDNLRTLARRHPDTLYLEWAIVDGQHCLLFTLSAREGIRAFSLPVGEKGLTALVSRWRTAITGQEAAGRGRRQTEPVEFGAPAFSEAGQAAALFRIILGPLEVDKTLQSACYAHIVLVPDGPLLDLPFAALRDRSGRRLVERYALSETASLGTLAWAQSSASTLTGTQAGLFCVADPLGQSRQRNTTEASRSSFSPLPFARQEGEQVAGLFPHSLALFGAAARKAQVEQQMSRFPLLHFATHGWLDTENGLRSALVLAPPAGMQMPLGDGLGEAGVDTLEAREILTMTLKAQMATLSACETGRGQQSGGEGLLGLAWAFQAAGCPCVVASQWSVDDNATAHLMHSFYQNLRVGQLKDIALRHAMLAVRAEPGHSQPDYWAAFNVFGNTTPLRVKAAGNEKRH